MGRDLAAALCLVLVIEGLLPFAAPTRWKAFVLRAATIDDASLRITGLLSMLTGAGLLFVVR